jgi:hypothetical protein
MEKGRMRQLATDVMRQQHFLFQPSSSLTQTRPSPLKAKSSKPETFPLIRGTPILFFLNTVEPPVLEHHRNIHKIVYEDSNTNRQEEDHEGEIQEVRLRSHL